MTHRYQARVQASRKVFVEGGGKPKKKEVLTIGALSKTAGSRQGAGIDNASKPKAEPVGRALGINELFFERAADRINQLLEDLSKVGGDKLPNRKLEVEVRLLQEKNPSNVGIFKRIQEWLNNIFPGVVPLQFSEIKANLPPSIFTTRYTATIVTRSPGDTHVKIKRSDDKYISMPSVMNIVPRLGISTESKDFQTTADLSPDDVEKRVRWSYPINSNTIQERGISLASLQGVEFDPNEPLARGGIDLTITYSGQIVKSYSIEIELNPDTVSQTTTIQAGEQPESLYLRLTKRQIYLLDSWTRVLIAVATRSGVFMSSAEKTLVEIEFNKAIQESGDTIRGKLTNNPKDLQKKDLAWLNPEDSELFMNLGDYDRSKAANSKILAAPDIKLYKPLMAIPGGFYVSLKADGTRFLLYFSINGIYLVNPKASVITKVTGEFTDYPEIKNILPQTVMDVEVIGDFGPDGTMGRYQILAFDIIALKGKDLRRLSYTDRLTNLQESINYINQQTNLPAGVNPQVFYGLLTIELKPVWRLPSISHLGSSPSESEINLHQEKRAAARLFLEILGSAAEKSLYSNAGESIIIESKNGEALEIDPIPQRTGTIEWYTDGIILTPDTHPYLYESDPYSQNKPGNKEYSLTRKWKPLMTIDFKVDRGQSGLLTLLMGRGEEFSRSDKYSWNGNAEIDERMEGQIWEFRWGYSEKFLDNAFIPLRIRYDKETPNSEVQVNDVWNLINDPITIDDLKGHSMLRMRRYHNRVKTSLLASIAKASGSNKPVLLDLGSGRGGDIDKWGNFSKIYAVEPDIQNLREFLQRESRRRIYDYSVFGESSHYSRMMGIHSNSHLLKTDTRRNITTVNAGAEDKLIIGDAISKGTVDCVSIFNALTFFYDSPTHLQTLIQTITQFLKPGGYCAIIALDGELLLNSMKTGEQAVPSSVHTDSEELPSRNQIKTRNIKIIKKDDPSCRKIWIEIEGGIVRGQYEYLINTREFVQLMGLFGFRLMEERYLNEELLMSDEEYWFSSMFKCMKFRYFCNPVKRELQSLLTPYLTKMKGESAIVPLEPNDLPQEVVSTQLRLLGIKSIFRYGNPQDGSCFLHAILRAFYRPYRQHTLPEKYGDIVQLRKELAANYTREIHEQLGDGFFRTSQLPAYSYENIKSSIGDRTFWVSSHLYSYFGDQLQTNVYILRGVDAEVYRFGGTSSHIKPGRKNVVLYWINDNHYETIGLLEGLNQVRTSFPDTHPFIQAINRLAMIRPEDATNPN